MAEGFEAYHVPQQSRRDKLRVAAEPTTSIQLHGGSISHHQQPYDQNHQNQLMMMMSIGGGGGSSSSDLLTCQNHNFRSPYYLDPQILYGASPQIAHSDAVLAFKPEPLTLSLSSYGNENSVNNSNSSSSNNNFAIAGLGSVPVGVFPEYYNNYPSVLRGSRFMRPAQQLLEELCFEVVGDRVLAASAEKLAPDSALMMMQTNAIVDDHDINDIDDGDGDGDGDGDDDDDDDHHHAVEIRKRKSRLISMLDEVYRRYKQYYQQMQAVVTSFECVGNAAPYANLAVKAMTKHFRCLKNAIMEQLQFVNKDNISVHTGHGKGGVYTQIRPIIHSSSSVEHHQPVWRPQRGLPERAVTVLRAWLFEHFLHPYPTDTDKMVLAKQTGLTRSQVSNWFINARVRLWKPMVEEIYMLETRQGQPKGTQRGDQNEEGNPASRSNNDRIANSVASSTSTDRVENPTTAIIAPTTLKRSRTELANLPVDMVNFTYGGLETMSMVGGGNGVSLTLGLQQDNNGICLAEPSFSINTAHRFGLGLEGSGGGEGYGMSAFEVQNRHFGRDVIGGQLHDFVG